MARNQALCKPHSSMDWHVRTLEATDYDRGFLELLGQLTVVGDVDRETFEKQHMDMEKEGNRRVVVVVDPQRDQVVATGTALIEKKFIRGCGCVAHVEDVVVDHRERGKQLGKRVIEDLLQYAQKKGCYKVILDCAETNATFYEKCGFRRKEVQMVQYF